MTDSEITLQQWLDEWLEVYVKPPVKTENTYQCYRYVIIMMKKLNQQLFALPLSEVDEISLQCFLNSAAQKYAKSTLEKVKIILRSAYKAAIRNHKCCFNPAEFLKVPKASEKVIRALTLDEEESVLAAARQDKLGHIVIFLLFTGLRACELCNLKWSDYDEKNSAIYIRRSKTKAGIRTVPLLYEPNKIIQSQPHYCDYIFTSTKHTPVTKTVLRKLYTRIRKATCINIVTNHVYTHSFATRLVEDKADCKAISVVLGHTNVAFTMHRYTNASDDFVRNEISVLETHVSTKHKPNSAL